MPCKVGGYDSYPVALTSPPIKVTYVPATLGEDIVQARTSTQDVITFKVTADIGSTDMWAAVGIRPADGSLSGMLGLAIYASDSGSGVYSMERATENAAPKRAFPETHYPHGSSMANGVLTFEFSIGVDETRGSSYNFKDPKSWEIVYAVGPGKVLNGWTVHTKTGTLDSSVMLLKKRCDQSAAAPETPAPEDGGMDVGIIVAIILGVLGLCGIIIGFAVYNMKKAKSVDYSEFVEQLNTDPDFNDDFEEAMKEQEILDKEKRASLTEDT